MTLKTNLETYLDPNYSNSVLIFIIKCSLHTYVRYINKLISLYSNKSKHSFEGHILYYVETCVLGKNNRTAIILKCSNVYTKCWGGGGSVSRALRAL